LLPEEVADAFVVDIVADTPDNEKCMEFADYVLNNYIEETARFPPQLWACGLQCFMKTATIYSCIWKESYYNVVHCWLKVNMNGRGVKVKISFSAQVLYLCP
jgi:hypothetical protein